jgi:GT2 family glycosyltransferase
MSGAKPTVSVVIPCYCYGHFLRDCVGSVLSQDDVVEPRVLIIDDASPDDSADVARRLAAEDDRIEVQVHPENRGHITTYNEGLLGWASGTYSALLSADDLMTPGSLGRATAVMEANPRVGFVYGHPIKFSGEVPHDAARTALEGVTIWPGEQWFETLCRLRHSVISSPEVVVRTEIQQRIGGYLPSLPHSGDAEMWLRFALHGDVAYLKGVDQAFYRTHASNMTKTRFPLVDLEQRKAAYDAVFDAHADRIPNRAQLRAQLDRGLAREALWEACSAFDQRQVSATPIEALEQFAGDLYPHTERLPEHWGLQWRKRVGEQTCGRLRPVLLTRVNRRVRNILWWRQWAREGV